MLAHGRFCTQGESYSPGPEDAEHRPLILEKLLQASADPNLPDALGRTALHAICQRPCLKGSLRFFPRKGYQVDCLVVNMCLCICMCAYEKTTERDVFTFLAFTCFFTLLLRTFVSFPQNACACSMLCLKPLAAHMHAQLHIGPFWCAWCGLPNIESPLEVVWQFSGVVFYLVEPSFWNCGFHFHLIQAQQYNHVYPGTAEQQTNNVTCIKHSLNSREIDGIKVSAQRL